MGFRQRKDYAKKTLDQVFQFGFSSFSDISQKAGQGLEGGLGRLKLV